MSVAKSIAQFCEERYLTIEAVYLANELNFEADSESRASQDASDWRLNRSVFHRISRLHLVDVDLFASAWNAQLSSFCSWKPQPGASNINAFSLNWNTYFDYAFPPFSLIFKCLEKILVQSKLLFGPKGPLVIYIYVIRKNVALQKLGRKNKMSVVLLFSLDIYLADAR